MNQIAFGRYLAWARNRMKLTQQELAEMANCAWNTISRIENGHELPCKRLFMELNRIFEGIGIIYDELDLDCIFEHRRSRKELLRAIRKGRLEEIERKLERFSEYMKDSEDDEDRQYYVLAYLISNRKRGLSIEDFLDEIVNVFEIRRNLPAYEDIPKVRLSKIEYEILFLMGEAHIMKGDREVGESILKGLMANRLDERSPYIKEKYIEISAILAKSCLMKKDYNTMEECLGYVFGEFIDKKDVRTLYHSLTLQGELCNIMGDKKGAKLVDAFLVASQKLMCYMCRHYRISKDIGCKGL